MSGVPHVVVVAGPNGAGKTTSAAGILPALGVQHFVNADTIARGLSEFRPEAVALQAGRIMLDRIRQLADARETFAFETTLAARSFAGWISELRRTGYAFDLLYFWLPDSGTAIARVAKRVRSGGHYVPDETVRRRYERGLVNFFHLYRPLTTHWRLFDNSSQSGPRLVAFGDAGVGTMVADEVVWNPLERRYAHGRPEKDDCRNPC